MYREFVKKFMYLAVKRLPFFLEASKKSKTTFSSALAWSVVATVVSVIAAFSFFPATIFAIVMTPVFFVIMATTFAISFAIPVTFVLIIPRVLFAIVLCFFIVTLFVMVKSQLWRKISTWTFNNKTTFFS